MTIEAFDRVHLDGMGIDRITEDEVVAVVRDALTCGRGGRIITPNVDIMRRAAADPYARRHLDDADLIVADGMPLIWASRLGGNPLPERVAGSSLIWSLSAGLARDARSVFLLGGTPAPGGTPGPGGTPAPGGTIAGRRTAVDPVSRRPAAVDLATGRSVAADSVAGRSSAADSVAGRSAAGRFPAVGRRMITDGGLASPAAAARPAAKARSAGARSRAATARAHETITRARAAAARNRALDAPIDRPGAEGAALTSTKDSSTAGRERPTPVAPDRAAASCGAARAAARLLGASPGLRIAGTLSPAYGFEEDEATYREVCDQVIAADPDLVFVGLGFPKQEIVIERLRPHLPKTWFVGCGAAVNFVAGDVQRAPLWMQRTGLEWAHRLGVEPRRLAGRYLRHDAPYALRLLAAAPRRRNSRHF